MVKLKFVLCEGKAYFKDTPSNKNDDKSRLFKQNKNKKWTPPNNHHTINTYVEAVKKDIEQSKTVTPRKIRPNLSKDEKVALKDLSKPDDIIITKVDKGGAVVIMGIIDYIMKAKHQLNDSKNYKVLAKDPTTTNDNLINQTIDRFTKEQLINENTANILKNISPRTPQFYISSKIDKKGNPGCPVISSINCHTANISKYIDYHLQPIIKQIPSCVKDTTNFINKINTVKSIPKKQLPSNNGHENIIYKYTKCRGNFSCKERIQQLLKENCDYQSCHNILGINTYSE